MNDYQISRRGLIEIALRYAIGWLMLATMVALLARYSGNFSFELGLFGLLLLALLAYLIHQWVRAYRGRWRITFSEKKVELPSIGKTDVESIESVRRFWRGPGQRCMMVKLRKGRGRLLKSTVTVYPQYYERSAELEANLEALAGHE